MDLSKKQKAVALVIKAFVDVLDGESIASIRHMTGLPLDRCNEIYNLWCLAQVDALPDD